MLVVVATLGVARQTSFNLVVGGLGLGSGDGEVASEGQVSAAQELHPPAERWFKFSGKHGLAYCSIPKAASSTLTAYLTGINQGLTTFQQAEQYILNKGGHSHFDFAQVQSYEWLRGLKRRFYFFTVTRHPGTRLYSAWFDKIHAHQGVGQPEMLKELCDGDPACTFETFVDGVIRFLSSGRAINEHIDLQSSLCGTQLFSYDKVYKMEDDFDDLTRQLERWTGVHFDFSSPGGEKGYSHHSKQAAGVYDDFPVDGMDAYKRLMPYEVQMKIYGAYQKDFEMFGYPAPVWSDTQLASCPVLPFVPDTTPTKWTTEEFGALRRL